MKKTILTSLALIGFLITHSVAHADFITAPVGILSTTSFQSSSVSTGIVAEVSTNNTPAPVFNTSTIAPQVVMTNTAPVAVFSNEATSETPAEVISSQSVPTPIFSGGTPSQSGNMTSLLNNSNNEVTTPDPIVSSSTQTTSSSSSTSHKKSGTLVVSQVAATTELVTVTEPVYVKKTFTVIPETEMVSEQVTEDVSNYDYSGTASVYGITAGITLIGILAIIASILGIAVLAREYRARNNRKIA
jgi:hypothetical protein